jgi:hypothetical protein
MAMRSPRAILVAASSALLVAALAALPLACGSSGPEQPVECDTGGTVTCTMDSICCPSADPFYCGGPADGDQSNVGCYPTLAQAAAVCGTEPGSDGSDAGTLAYQCH